MKNYLIPLVVALSLPLISTARAQTTYTWNGGPSGSWSNSTNWNPNGTPGSADTANLNNVGATTIVTYDGGASGSLNTLNLTQSGAFTNELLLSRTLALTNLNLSVSGGLGVVVLESNLSVTNAITLSASSGTSEIWLHPVTAGAVHTLTASGGLTIASGGLLEMGSKTSVTVAGSGVTGNVSMTGGAINVEKDSGSVGSVIDTISGSYLMTGGVLTIGATTGGAGSGANTTLLVGGNFTGSGGAITRGSGATKLLMQGATNKIMATTFNTGVDIALQANGNQTLETDVTLGRIYLRPTSGSGGTSTRQILQNNASATVGQIVFEQQSDGGTTKLQLVSNLTATAGSAMVTSDGQGSPGAGKTTSFVIDTGTTTGYTLDLSQSIGSFTPNNNGAATANWALQGTGTIKASSFTLNSASGNVNVSGSVTLRSTGGNAAANVLSGNGSIAATSTFIYSGTASRSNEATLVSTRTIGSLVIQGGFLKTNQAALTLGGGASVTSSGGLDLGGVGTVATLTVGTGRDFLVNSATLVLDLGTSFDAILGNGGTFSLSGLTLAIDQGAGFSFANSYQILSGFSASSALGGINLTDQNGVVISNFTGNISSAGALTFQSVPEPATWVLLGVGAVLLGIKRKRRLQ